MEALKRQKLEVRADVAPASRALRIVNPAEEAAAAALRSAAPTPEEEPADDFYEVTADDLRALALGGGGGGDGGGGGQLKTRAMRELEALQSMPTYGHALVRVRLPGGLVLQAAFHPQEAVGAVLAEVRGCLSPTLQSAQPYLFVTPPRRVLDVSLSLAAAGLVPAATLLLGFDPPVSAGAAGSTPSEVLSARALALLAAPPDAAAAPQPSFPSALNLPSRSAAGGGGALAPPLGSTSGEAAAAGKGKERKVPKWLQR